jgi:hypothetical protein
MTAILTASGTSIFTYRGSLDFLDSQTSFASIFPHPIPTLLGSSATSSVVVNTTSVVSRMNQFIDQCKFSAFLPIFRTDYVGTVDRNDATSLLATVKSIKELKMARRDPASGKWIHCTPDDLYAQYSLLTPLFPSGISLWGFNLATQFLDALSSDVYDLLSTNPL